jgi:uncharacterized protein (TIGR02391 family)
MITDREAARMRAEKVVNEISGLVHRALRSGKADGMTLHNTFPPAAHEMVEKLCKIYAEEVVGSSEPPLFDELKTEIANRVNAFISSTVAGIRGTNAGAAARTAANLQSSVSASVHGTFLLATHDATKARGGAPKHAAPLTLAAIDAIAAFKSMPIHPVIRAACVKLFEDGHYRNAVQDAMIALVNMVKQRTGNPTDGSGKVLDNTPLMREVFGGVTPRLKVNAFSTSNEKSEQEGMMFLFSGATLALRNPRAHGLAPDTAEFAVEAIAFISMLAKVADAANP